MDATGCSDEDANRALDEADGDFDVALIDLEADQIAMLEGLAYDPPDVDDDGYTDDGQEGFMPSGR